MIPGRVADVARGDGLNVRLIAGPIHTDLLLPLTPAARERFAVYGVGAELAAAEWLVVGWGARDFYTQTGSYADLSLRAVWRAAVGDSAVMRMDVAGALPPDLRAARIALSHAQYAVLLDQITADVANVTPLDVPGFGTFDRFFAATGRFHLLNTCNVWIGRTLRSAGVPFGVWTPTPFAMRLSHWLYG
ncbi:MAG: DUF2459 domain-containing protein [Pseudomonadota bacterium]